MNYSISFLSNQLNGRTCFTSRIKNQNITESFHTLHSLVYKVLRKSNSYSDKNALLQELSGADMFENIKNAIKNSTNKEPTNEQVLHYYYSLRTHQNNGGNINTIQGGPSILNKYQSIKNNTMDWEESMQMATWYLNQDLVSSLEKFHFDNIILLNPELLGQKRNKNALEFFQALCRWSLRHNNWNIYSINGQGNIYQHRGEKTTLLNLKLQDDCHLQSSF